MNVSCGFIEKTIITTGKIFNGKENVLTGSVPFIRNNYFQQTKHFSGTMKSAYFSFRLDWIRSRFA